MVHVVEESIYGQGYREINQQLAKENGELRQQLSQALQEICQQRIEIHQKDVEIVQLKGQLKELKKVHERYKAIRDIVGRESIGDELNSTRKEKENVNDETESKATNAESYYLDPIAEVTEHDDKDEDEDEDDDDGEQIENEYNQTICSPENDSLEPPEVTSVPPVDYCERTMQTPSIWNCLDTLGSPPSFSHDNHHNNDILHSTPVQPLKAANKKEPEPETQPRYNLRKRTKR
jgi:hypothetical protein